MHGLCAHESSDNLSNDPRPLLSLGYMAMEKVILVLILKDQLHF